MTDKYDSKNKRLMTFIDLYNFLRNHLDESIIGWLKINWKGKDKQESLFRLFAKLGLIKELDGYHICNGNYNLGTIEPLKDKHNIFYDDKGNSINLKDKGDAADLVAMDEKDDRRLLCFSSKNINKENIGKLDIEKIYFYAADKYKDYTIIFGLVVRDKRTIDQIKTDKTSKRLKEILETPTTIILDWNNLDQAYRQFKTIYKNINIADLLQNDKPPIILKLHQIYSVNRTYDLLQRNEKDILWGHICRSGKSYIMAGLIIKDAKNKHNCNYIIFTTAPNETIEQYIKVMQCQQLDGVNVIYVNGTNTAPQLMNKNIIIVSKQFIQILDENNIEIKKVSSATKVKKAAASKKVEILKWLAALKIDIRFIDESHNGGTTQIVKNTLDVYGGKQTPTIHISATYLKTAKDYCINKSNWILWDLEDITLCKKYNAARLIEKHGSYMKDALNQFNQNSIVAEYSKYPEMWIITEELTPEAIREARDYNNTHKDNFEKGWSLDACFLLNYNDKGKYVNTFQNKSANLHLWYRIFGKKEVYKTFTDDAPATYTNDRVILKRIQRICEVNGSRTFNKGEPLIIMAYLPMGNCPIELIQSATKELLETENVIPEFSIICINSKITNDPKKVIMDGISIAKRNNKKGILVLSGRQCSLGITLEQCDVVLLLNNSTSFDMNFQMMFRSMTEAPNKKYGFIVDLNIHRCITSTLLNFISLLNNKKSYGDIIKYILREKILRINGDHIITRETEYIGGDLNNKYINDIAEMINMAIMTNTDTTLKHYLDMLNYKRIILSKDDGILFKNIFTYSKVQMKQIMDMADMAESQADKNIKEGIEKIKIDADNLTAAETEATELAAAEEDKKNLIDLLKHIIPLICILTIHDDNSNSFESMSKYILLNLDLLQIFRQQMATWWGNETDKDILNTFTKLFIKYLENDNDVFQIIANIKNVFKQNIKNARELSKLIDKYLVPHEIEKRQNAEVSTPYTLRQEMLDTITKYGDPDFWKTPKRVFEPCAGKGGFLLDIIDRFMNGLVDEEKDEEARYKKIVEECLYWSELNPVNVFICKLLIDPYGKYEINYNEGNTLELDITKEKKNGDTRIWKGVNGFDLVVGNPPYQKYDGASNGTLWDKFVIWSINITNNLGYICMIHPSGWRNINGKFKKLQKEMVNQNLIYLEIHNESDGIKTFKAETRYDWYIMQKIDIYHFTKVKFEDNKIMDINIRELEFIPNGQFDLVQKLLAKTNEKKCEILYNRSSYGCDKIWVSKKQDQEYKYPCVYIINSKSELKLFYSNKNNGNGMNKIKLMWSNGRIKSIGSVIDQEGKYGLTNYSYGIVDTLENLNNIKKVFDSVGFRKLMEYCAVGQLSINYKIIALFKKDFWKEFINEY